MRKYLLLAVLIAALAAPAVMAEVDVKSSGSKVTTAVAVDFYGPAVTKAGGVAIVDTGTMTGNVGITGDLDVTGDVGVTGDTTLTGGLVVDGTIYTATIAADGAIYPGMATLDPCGTLGRGYIFFNDSGMPCFCNALGVDLSLYDGSTACF